jgi:phosphatidylglycerol lysyltransferase
VDDTAERTRVLALLRRYGRNATSFQVLEEGFRYAFDEERDAVVAYVDTGRAWVVAGAPIGDESCWREVVERFLARARAARRRACFFGVEDRFIAITGLPALNVGEQPTWEPARWDESLRGARSLREQLRRARAKGVVAHAIDASHVEEREAPVRRAMDALITRWLVSRGMAPMGFLVDVQPFSFPRERRYFVAERAGELVAFLACVPVYARDGWFFEDLLRNPDAPNGSAELLVDCAMRALAAEGARYATLGLAPLAGPVSGGLAAARVWTRALYDFEGVRAFKAKLRPHAWEPIHVAYLATSSANAALYDALAAFARGSFARFGIESILHGPAVVVRVLAALLIPWTFALAVASPRWFPAPWEHAAWVVFDAALAAGLFWLAARWRAPLARALATAVTLDAVLTTIEVVSFNAPRVKFPMDGLVLAIACAAPTLAAVILWSAIGHRRRGQPLETRAMA